MAFLRFENNLKLAPDPLLEIAEPKLFDERKNRTLHWRNKLTGEVFTSPFMDKLFYASAGIDWTRFDLEKTQANGTGGPSPLI